ncbi:Transcription factor 25 [Strongyloides ratti]|uniref:Transcription factor 25 n=1 Tax=Strongyloides ratti TaxID=34506 RepID=A0A090LC42_STRRB|nr:Transcription factor 25 [Strongyloides ratti]CEF65678.1 Transcription factor 25 [Strongyloides ratti]
MNNKKIFKNYKVEEHSDSEDSDNEIKVKTKTSGEKIDLAKIESEEIERIKKRICQLEISERKKIEDNEKNNGLNNLQNLGDTKTPFKKVDLWKIDPKNLDPDAEYKRILGAAFNGLGTRESRFSNMNRNRRGGTKQFVGKLMKKPRFLEKDPGALSMKMIDEKYDIKYFKFVPSKIYVETQLAFRDAVDVFDIEWVLNTIRTHGFHLPSAAVAANALIIQDHSQDAKDLIEWGIWFGEYCCSREFDIFSPNHRLPYIFEPNRAFFILLHMYMKHCIDRKCYETAFQYAKIIYMKDVVNDPLSILMCIDTLALKAGNSNWLINFYDEFNTTIQLEWLPNFLYSLALVYNQTYLETGEEIYKEKADEFIQKAFVRFPFLVTLFLDKMSMFADSGIENYSFGSLITFVKQPIGYQYLIKVYLHHAIDILKKPENIAFLDQKSRHYFELIQKDKSFKLDEVVKKRSILFIGVPRSLKRHMALFQIENMSANNFSDPFPPKEVEDDVESLAKKYGIKYEHRQGDDNQGSSENALFNYQVMLDLFTNMIPFQMSNIRERAGALRMRIQELIEDHREIQRNLQQINNEEDFQDNNIVSNEITNMYEVLENLANDQAAEVDNQEETGTEITNNDEINEEEPRRNN